MMILPLETLPEGETRQFGPCYARLSEAIFCIGNAHIERRWRVENGLLYPTSLVDRATGQEWLARFSDHPAPYPERETPEEPRAVRLACGGGQAGPTEARSLVAELTAAGASLTLTYRFQVFPDARGIVVDLRVISSEEAAPSRGQADTAAPAEATPTGIEAASEPEKRADGPLPDVLEALSLAPLHLRLTQVTLYDQTDQHNELAQERAWLLHPAEGTLTLAGNLFFLEDTLTRSGLIFLKQAPLPHARPVTSSHDLQVAPRDREVRLRGHGAGAEGDGYRFVTLAYTDGAAGRVAALHAYQRQVRVYVPERDGLFLSNTWGDRARDGRVTEAFLTQEVAAAARLGVEVVQIDDGWQQGRTANSVASGGVWEGFWAAHDRFWDPHPERFPHGLEPIIAAARERGMQFGLWFAPDSTDDFAHWERDAATILDLHRRLGVSYFKIDGVKLRSKRGERHLGAFFAAVLRESDGRVVFDTDVTAEVRPGYFGLLDTGPIFVENRYTDWRRYWPHQTLRNLWKLAHYIDPVRLRMEFLNHARNTDRYEDDPLAPARYGPAYLFATTLLASPLGWFEVSNLPETYFAEVAPLARVWKAHREALFGGRIFPIGDAPDGTAWTGFLSLGADRKSGYLLLFRERNDRNRWTADLPIRSGGTFIGERLGGNGAFSLADGVLTAEIPNPQDFLFGRFTSG